MDLAVVGQPGGNGIFALALSIFGYFLLGRSPAGPLPPPPPEEAPSIPGAASSPDPAPKRASPTGSEEGFADSAPKRAKPNPPTATGPPPEQPSSSPHGDGVPVKKAPPPRAVLPEAEIEA